MSNVLPPKPTPRQLRAELEKMVLNDLLGPAAGDNEELTERNVRDRYVVGVLAPRRQAADSKPQAAPEEPEEDTPLIPDELSQGGADSMDDGTTDMGVPLPRAHLPSSFGMTFCVVNDTKALRVSAHWGQYLRERNEEDVDQKTGKGRLVWKRHPRGGMTEIPLKEGRIRPTPVDNECPEVYVQGLVRKRNTHWVVSLFMINGQEEPRFKKDETFLFQPEIIVEATDGSAIFEKRPQGRNQNDDLERVTMDMLYRHQVEFVVGHGVGVHAEVSKESPERAVQVRTKVVPVHEVPTTTPPTASDADRNPAFALLDGLVLDMKELSEASAKQLRSKLQPLITAYGQWIDGEAAKLTDPVQRLAPFQQAAQVAIEKCRTTLQRIEAGLQLLEQDAQAAEAFSFMNRAMWYQRTHSIYSEQIRRGDQPDFDKQIDMPQNRRWYPFQLAFILLNLPGVTKLDHPDRGESQEALADLLFFPTGGGKTEAYLGLTAYVMGMRRLQGTVAGRTGDHGVAVLMRYTLRLLTIQQFQRATALMCACEMIRRAALEKGDKRWGNTPFRIGLWVGLKTTPNWTDDSHEAVQQLRGNGFAGTGMGSPYQLTNCPWCGSWIDPGHHLEAKRYNEGPGRTFIYCGDKYGNCPFSRRQAAAEGLPVMVVDEEIYRNLPTLLIATVDKFAQMPWNGAVQMLFGQVDGRCSRHGFRSPEIEDKDSHPKTKTGLPAASTQPHLPLRPPDLIIQDELHLISGPLGTLVGLYETAIDKLCTWEVYGKKVRPKVIASTATIRNADVQVHKLFLRKVNIFPAQGLDVRDNFFSLQREASEEYPGRLYLGICAPGRRVKAALIRVYVAYLCAAQKLYDDNALDADPWMTLVGYFNSMRELGGVRRLVFDDISARTKKMDRRGLAKRLLNASCLEELTSRMRSEDIPKILDRLEAVFDPEAAAKRKEKKKARPDERQRWPIDVLLATNMVSVGVDVRRLGLMVVCSQPKTTAEYIQATSRVGRAKPGLVCTVFNWARPRDMSHYETFEHYHATFYKHVEALSVTPFSVGALQRGLAGLLVSMVRLPGTEFNANERAALFQAAHPYVYDAIEAICRRASLVGDGPEVVNYVRAELQSKVDLWQAEAQNTIGGRTLAYDLPRGSGAGAKRGTTVNLLNRPGLEKWEPFTCLNSLREVEPTVKLIMDDGGLDDVPDQMPVAPEANVVEDDDDSMVAGDEE
ncbi:MAG: DISARM system helicase DrmA [Planctomycetota bacterium]